MPGDGIGQAPARAKLTDLNDTQLKELAGYIEQWLSRDFVQEHVDYFFAQGGGGGVHTTRNFLGWRRTQIWALEDFLSKQPNGPAYVPLPAWEPTDASGNIQPIPNYFNGWDPVAGEPYWNFIDPDAIDIVDGLLSDIPGLQPPFGYDEYFDDISPYIPYVYTDPMFPANNYDMTAICDYQDVGAFSDWFEVRYHARGHSQVGQAMVVFSSPACLIFWPWHAQVDDQWYRWEEECNGNYTIIDPAPITSTVSWNSNQWVKGEVIIESGGHLEIGVGAKISFQDSEYNSRRTRIWVKPGGKLTINNGAVLGGIDILGTGGGMPAPAEDDEPDSPATLTGVAYNTPWEGILLENGGTVEIYTGTIRHARTGIRNNGGGGLVIAQNATFENNRRDVVLGSFSSQNKNNASKFTGCWFVNDSPLRDVVWPSAHIGLDPSRFYTYKTHPKLPPFPENHVELYSVSGIVFQGCKFESQFSADGTSDRRSRGIYSLAAGFECKSGCIFTRLDEGIRASTYFEWNPTNVPLISDGLFTDNVKGIVLISASMAKVERCNFDIPAEVSFSNTKPLGIAANAGSGFIFTGNIFKTRGASTAADNIGIWARNSCQLRPNWIAANTFTDVRYGVQTESENPDLQIRCNGFEGFGNGERYAIAVASGELANQGDCDLFPAGNTWDHDVCGGVESQIFKDAGALPFEYDAHEDRLPSSECVSAGILVENCGFSSGDVSCEDMELFLAKDDEARESRIAALTQEIAAANDPTLLAELKRERLTEAYQGMLEKLAGEPAGTAYEYLKQKEAQGIGIYKGDLASLAMEDGKFTEAAAYIEQMGEEEQPDKAYMEKVYAVRLDGRGPGALTPEEKEEIIVEHGHGLPCGAPFQDYLEYKKDNPDTEPEIVITPVGRSIEGRPAIGDIATTASPSSELLLYPNPSTGLLTAQWQMEGPVELNVFTSTGHQAWAYKGANEGPISINLSHLPPGLYLLTFRTENGLLSRKILLSN